MGLRARFLRVKIAEFEIGRWREQIDIFFLDMSGILPIGVMKESFYYSLPGIGGGVWGGLYEIIRAKRPLPGP